MATTRAVRTFTAQPVGDDVVEKVLRAASYAASARNAQPWRFIVVRETETKRRLGAIFDELGALMYGAGAPDRTPWEDVPVLMAVCSEYAFGSTEAGLAALGASIYPAVENLLLAARALGLGAVLTTAGRASPVRPLLELRKR
jgi:nitroreductase